ncbi:hypothetical protein O3P69_003616 [Scylla paramamosain]|uniref:Uncharacterized protein n=1 Tax=Scylla paramamosain TaxID=85552 RepID=A0AAW0UIS7_SCYPA
MSRVGCVMIWVGVLCVGVPSVTGVDGVNDVGGVQVEGRPHTQGRLLKKMGHSKVKVRARQWARKLQRRLLRLCPRQTAALLTPASRATRKRWAVAGGEYLRAVALHGERPARGLPLRRQKLSHLLDVLMSLFPASHQSTTTAPATATPEGKERSVRIGNGLEESVVGWLNFNTSSPRLLGLVSALAPAILRVGGSAANFVTYDPRDTPTSEDNENGGHGANEQETRGQEGSVDNQEATDEGEGFKSRCYDSQFSTPIFTNFTITREDWARLLHFSRAVGMQLLFDLNQFYRKPDGSWDPSNAHLLLRDACSWGFSVAWQLGNEPNSYKHKFGIVVTGEQTARDYEILSKVLEEACPSAPLVGPDVTRPKKHHHKSLRPRHRHRHRHHHRQRHSSATLSSPEGAAGVGTNAVDYLESFLNSSTFNLSALTWHQYYVNGHEAAVGDFMDPDVMNQLTWQVEQIVVVRNHLAPGRPIWLTETGSASGWRGA